MNGILSAPTWLCLSPKHLTQYTSAYCVCVSLSLSLVSPALDLPVSLRLPPFFFFLALSP